MRSLSDRHFGLLLLALGAILFLGNLGNMYLWQDEAETALLSQRLGEYGLPLAFDGRNLIRQAPQDIQYTSDYVWVYHPWLPFYFTSISFMLLGTTTFAARLPFALAGLLTVLLTHSSLRRHFVDRRIAQLGALLLLLCVPFILHSRQCKYFSLAALFTVASIDAYLHLRRRPAVPWALPYLIISAFLLFQSNFGAFVPLMAAMSVHYLLTGPRRSDLVAVVVGVAIVALYVLPWAVYLQTWARGRFVFDVYRFAGHLAHYVVYITGWILPWPLLLFLPYEHLRLWRPTRATPLGGGEASIINLYVTIILVTVVFLSASFIWMYFSYIVQLVPLLCALLAFVLVRLSDRRACVGWALLLVLVATNVLHMVPYVFPQAQAFKWASLAPRRYLAETDALIVVAGKLRSDLAQFAYELTHDYDDPNEGVALYLAQHAKPGDIVLANYGELPIAFYTGLDIAGGLSGYRLDKVTEPNWVINRQNGPYRDEVDAILARGRYDAIEIPYPDLPWGNRPVPEYHKFATVHEGPNVVLHRRME